MSQDPQPLARPGRVHQFQSFAAPPPFTGVPFLQPVPAVYPDQLRGRPARAHEFQTFAMPPRAVVAPTPQPVQPIVPDRLVGRVRRVHQFQSYAAPGKFVTPVAPLIPGIGSAGAATFMLSLEPGAKVTYGWHTTVTTSYSGKETRESTLAQPKRRFSGAAFLLDAADRDVKGALVRAAAQGSTFLLSLPFEELTISAASPNTVVTVASTTRADWALPGQRAIIVGVNGATVGCIVQSVTATTITIATVDKLGNFTFGTLGPIGNAGGRIMPTVQVLLEPQQGFSRYPTTVDLWSISAASPVFGWAGVDSMGIGTSITTATDGLPVAVSALVDADVFIWDRINAIDATVNETMIARTDLVDLGALPFNIGGATVPDWGRSIKMRSSSLDDWAWFKAFIRHVRGQQVPFLLSTNRPDLVFDSSASGGIKVKSASVAGGGDYVSWFNSGAHRRLAVTAGGTVQYANVSAVVDNGNGTLTLSLDSVPTGTITQISFLESVRLASDDIEVSWDSGTFSAEVAAQTVQEAIQVPQRFLFDAVVSNLNLTFPITPPKLLGGALGNTTLVLFSSDRSLNVGGILNTGAGGNTDGMVVCVCNLNNDNHGMAMVHEDTNQTASSRVVNNGLADINGSRNAIWYRYNGALQRWVETLSSV